jgi:hypothetical protein
MIAQITDIGPDWLKNMAIFITCLAMTTYYVRGIFTGKQKREISFTEEAASKREFDQFTATTNTNFVQIRDEMKRDRESNQIHASQRSQTLFTQMEKTRSDLDTKVEDVRRELSEKIDDMPERIITTLKNTGAI